MYSLSLFSGETMTGRAALLVAVLAACGTVQSTSPDAADDAEGMVMLTVTPTGHGTITSAPAGINCGTTCSASFPAGTMVMLIETPDAGATFTGWSGAGCSGMGTCVVTVTTVTSVGAMFGCDVGIQIFNYTGTPQVFSHPTCATQIIVNAFGAQGGMGSMSGTGGNGGRVQAKLAIAESDVITIYVGSAGTNAVGNLPGSGGNNGGAAGAVNGTQSGGGGGGASDIRINGTALGNRVLVAGGGGGGATCNNSSYVGGLGGGLIGGSGSVCDGLGAAAKGGTQTGGGSGGQYPSYCTGAPGVLGSGGPACAPTGGGGGGGGYFGGGGASWTGGGGGSSFTSTATAVTHTQGTQPGNGLVTIAW